jgi:hypothetical protein
VDAANAGDTVLVTNGVYDLNPAHLEMNLVRNGPKPEFTADFSAAVG